MRCLKQLIDADIVYWKCLQGTGTNLFARKRNGTGDESCDGRTNYCSGILSKAPGTTSQRKDAEERAQQDNLQLYPSGGNGNKANDRNCRLASTKDD